MDSEVQEIADAQGWSDTTLLDLALEFIGRDGYEATAFVAYLRRIAHEENGDYW